MVANPTFYKKTGDPIWHLSGAFEHNFGPCGISKGRCVDPEVGGGGGGLSKVEGLNWVHSKLVLLK